MSFDEAYWISRADAILEDGLIRMSLRTNVIQQLNTLFILAPRTYWNNLLASIEKWEDNDDVTPEFVGKFNRVWDARKQIRAENITLRDEETETLKELLELTVDVIRDMREFKEQETEERDRE